VLTAEVVIVKFAEVAPAAIVTLEGVTTLELLDVRLTTSPPTGAPPFSVTVPVLLFPPTTELGVTDREVRFAGGAVMETLSMYHPAPELTPAFKWKPRRIRSPAYPERSTGGKLVPTNSQPVLVPEYVFET